MRHLSIMQRTAAIRKHLEEAAVAAQYQDVKRMQGHLSVISDHLGEIDASCDILRTKAILELGPK